MNKYEPFRQILIVISIVLIGSLTYVIYFAYGMTRTIDPIKTYTYDGNAKQFIESLKSYEKSNSAITCDISDTLGNQSNGVAYPIIVDFKNDKDTLRFDLKCIDTTYSDKSVTLELIGAHNLANNNGGYGLKANGMNELLNNFNAIVITPL